MEMSSKFLTRECLPIDVTHEEVTEKKKSY